MSASNLELELTQAHDRAREAYARRDVTAYMSMFHPELQYTQADGRTIDRDRLERDVHAQLSRVHRASTAFRCETLEPVGADGAREVVEQQATFEVRAFWLLRREWAIRRRGRYEWLRSADGWKICRVEVLSEEVTSRTWLSLR